jgi:hypothetical protein
MATPFSAIKTSFSGGEFAPSLYSRVDLQKYASGCRRLRNFIVHPHGGASNRPGLQFIAKAKYGNKKSILQEFEFSTTQAYQIEFGDYYARFYMNGGQIAVSSASAWVTSTSYTQGAYVSNAGTIYYCITSHTSGTFATDLSGGKWVAQTIYEIPTPYSESDLELLDFGQSADVLYITHPSKQQRTLSRLGHTLWVIALYNFVDGPFMSTNTTATTLTSSATTGTVTLTASTSIFLSTNIGSLYMMKHYIEGGALAQAFASVTTSASVKCGGTWRVITHGTWAGKFKIEKSTDGGATWSNLRTFSSTSDFNANTYGTETDQDPFLIRINFYAYTSGTCNLDLTTDPYTQTGVVKVTAYSSGTSVTASVQREVGNTTATKEWSEGSWSERRGFPSTVTFDQDRLAFASTPSEPLTTWMTETSDYLSFRRSSPLVDSDGISVNLASRKMNGITSLVPLGELLAFTSSSEWSIRSTNGVVTPTTVTTKVHGYSGSSNVSPVLIGNKAVFVQPMGSVVRDFGYSFSSDSFEGEPLSLMSNHLFSNYEIIDLSYQQEPDSIVWAVRNDGVMLSMTYMKEQEVLAWAWHDTEGSFESVSTISGDGYNETWVVVKRGADRFIERFVNRMKSTDPRDQFFVDCGTTYDRPLTITGIAGTTQLTVTSASHGLSDGDEVDLSDVLGMTTTTVIDSTANPPKTLTVSLVNNVRFVVSDKTTDTFKLKDLDGAYVDGTLYTSYESGGYVRLSVSTLTGLSYLDGKTVSILADGNVLDRVVVSSGTIDLGGKYSRIHVGLPYQSDLETLSIEVTLPDGTAQGRMVQIPSVILRMLNSRGGFIGGNENSLAELVQRENENYDDPVALFSGDTAELIPSDYVNGGRIFFRQVDPLPATILAVIPTVVIGGS